MGPIYHTWSTILDNQRMTPEEIKPAIYKMKLECVEIAQMARPGQFVTLICGPQTILRRPFSIALVEKEEHICLLYNVVGSGTTWLSEKQEGEEIDILGPLGKKGFIVAPNVEVPLLVGGGVGTSPLFFLLDTLLPSNTIQPLLLMGGKTANSILPIIPPRLKTWISLATEDGSLCHHGKVTELLEKVLLDKSLKAYSKAVYASGPRGMLKGVAELAQRYGIPCYVCLEGTIACGLGACYGCTFESTHKGFDKHKRVCQGPVFPAEEINWNAYIKV